MTASSPSLFTSVRGRLWIIVALSLIGAVTSIVPLIAVIELARTLLPSLTGAPVDQQRAWLIVGIAATALVISFATAGASGMVSHLADGDLQLDLRRRLIHVLRRLPLGWFDARSSGAVKKAVENDINALHQLVAHAIQDLITALSVPALSLIYLFAVEWRMALASMLPLVVAIALYAVVMGRSADKYQTYDASLERLNEATVEYVHGIAVVKAFGQGGRSHTRFRRNTDDFAEFYGGWMRETSVQSTLVEIITSPVVVLVYLCSVGSALTIAGVTEPIEVLPALLLGMGLTAPLLQLGWTAQFLRAASQARVSLTRFFEQPVIADPSEPVSPADSTVALADVSFSYNGLDDVLRQITLTCRPGTVTALVGVSGSGKSTLASLIPRFYDTPEGMVSIGGADVRQIPSADLYTTVGFVFQDSHLLRASIRDNIRLTRPDAADADVVEVAKAAQIHDRIVRFPRGYDTVVGQDAHFSGGEAQRLTIARAMLTDAPVLVLDEATAFADPDSEAAIQRALSALAARRTLIVIAHRLHTIVHADQIAVLDNGRIVETGTHRDLVEASGTYQRLWDNYEAARRLAMPAGSAMDGSAGR